MTQRLSWERLLRDLVDAISEAAAEYRAGFEWEAIYTIRYAVVAANGDEDHNAAILALMEAAAEKARDEYGQEATA